MSAMGTNATALLDEVSQMLHDITNDPDCCDEMAARHKIKSGLIDSILEKMATIESI